MNDLHLIQTRILLELARNSRLTFGEFKLPTEKNIEKDLFNYHLKQMIRFGYVTKEQGKYSLTDAGKDHVSYLDFETTKPEKLPKVSVMVFVFSQNRESVLLCTRLKHPYLHAITPVTGKVRQGETFQDTARREVEEETGLHLTSVKHLGFIRSIDRDAETILFDGIFSVHVSQTFEGKLRTITDSKEVENKWIKTKDALKNKHMLTPSKHVLKHILKNNFEEIPFISLDQKLEKY